VDATEINALADRFIAGIEAGDVSAVAECYHPDAVIWHNFDQVAQSREANLAVLGWLVAKVADRRYDDIVRVVLPDGFVQQHVLRGDAPGGRLEVPAMIRVTVSDGLIVRLDEYLDTAQLAALRA
jgi:ketosteroid isomerase-like protein